MRKTITLLELSIGVACAIALVAYIGEGVRVMASMAM